ncbi:MAG: hemerythrin domain-containing protein [Alphaproteobacteria bacterium]|nr:hemerythrin domain-containing protein [Alphaproteobacteria bacterium]
MAQAIDIIRREHSGLATVLSCLERTAHAVAEPEATPDFELLLSILVYIQNFADRFHHPKEDEYLFRALRRRRPESGATLDALAAEHKEGERLLADLRDRLDALRSDVEGQRDRFAEAALQYVAFERKHMATEEREVIPAAKEALQAEDWRGINAAFAANEDPLFGARPRAEFERLLERINALSSGPGRRARFPQEPL